jgi:hypothetical protein
LFADLLFWAAERLHSPWNGPEILNVRASGSIWTQSGRLNRDSQINATRTERRMSVTRDRILSKTEDDSDRRITHRLLDVIEVLPEDHPLRRRIERLFDRLGPIREQLDSLEDGVAARMSDEEFEDAMAEANFFLVYEFNELAALSSKFVQ